jgi:hypothetical protein
MSDKQRGRDSVIAGWACLAMILVVCVEIAGALAGWLNPVGAVVILMGGYVVAFLVWWHYIRPGGKRRE